MSFFYIYEYSQDLPIREQVFFSPFLSDDITDRYPYPMMELSWDSYCHQLYPGYCCFPQQFAIISMKNEARNVIKNQTIQRCFSFTWKLVTKLSPNVRPRKRMNYLGFSSLPCFPGLIMANLFGQLNTYLLITIFLLYQILCCMLQGCKIQNVIIMSLVPLAFSWEWL